MAVKMMLLVVLFVLSAGCSDNFEEPWPRYYYYFERSNKWIPLVPGYIDESAKCIGSIKYRAFVYPDLPDLLKYEKPQIMRCADKNNCVEWTECKRRDFHVR